MLNEFFVLDIVYQIENNCSFKPPIELTKDATKAINGFNIYFDSGYFVSLVFYINDWEVEIEYGFLEILPSSEVRPIKGDFIAFDLRDDFNLELTNFVNNMVESITANLPTQLVA